jgi:guanylate kinase
MTRHGIALVLSAPSGAGKTTLLNRLRAEFPGFAYSVSCTTRAPRPGETDGKDYYFLPRETFERRRAENYFAEWAEVHGNLYGTPLEPVKEALRRGTDLIFDIDVQGAAQLKLSLAEALFVFILPPGLDELESRLRGRGQDDEASIQRRLANARSEMAQARWYDALVVNDDLDQAYDRLRAAYLAATLAPARNPGLVEALLAR